MSILLLSKIFLFLFLHFVCLSICFVQGFYLAMDTILNMIELPGYGCTLLHVVVADSSLFTPNRFCYYSSCRSHRYVWHVLIRPQLCGSCEKTNRIRILFYFYFFYFLFFKIAEIIIYYCQSRGVALLDTFTTVLTRIYYSFILHAVWGRTRIKRCSVLLFPLNEFSKPTTTCCNRGCRGINQ